MKVDLDALEALHAKATPGPRFVREKSHEHSIN